MRPAGWWTVIFWICKTLQWLSGTGLVLFAVIQPMDPSLSSIPYLSRVIATLQPLSRPAVVAFGGGVVLFKWLAYSVGPPWIWKAIQAVFNEFGERAFNRKDDDPVHYHRVTLFQYVQLWKLGRLWLYPWRWQAGRLPWSGWLVPVARSGHTTKRCNAVFLAPDDADRAEGVAGQVWATNSQILVEELPALDSSSSDEVIADYATRTFVPEEWVRARLTKPLPRSLCGVPIEVDGRIWGVLVLDSRVPKAIKPKKVSDLVDFVGIVLRHLLRRAK